MSSRLSYQAGTHETLFCSVVRTCSSASNPFVIKSVVVYYRCRRRNPHTSSLAGVHSGALHEELMNQIHSSEAVELHPAKASVIVSSKSKLKWAKKVSSKGPFFWQRRFEICFFGSLSEATCCSEAQFSLLQTGLAICLQAAPKEDWDCEADLASSIMVEHSELASKSSI